MTNWMKKAREEVTGVGGVVLAFAIYILIDTNLFTHAPSADSMKVAAGTTAFGFILFGVVDGIKSIARRVRGSSVVLSITDRHGRERKILLSLGKLDSSRREIKEFYRSSDERNSAGDDL
jgi:hypothetical protein